MKWLRSLQAFDFEFAKRTLHAFNCFGSGAVPDDDLGKK
jgi:hypothetical protein